MTGSWVLEDNKTAKLPQNVASGFTVVTGSLVGVEYRPILFGGQQVVNGVNYCVIAEQTTISETPAKKLVKMIINESPKGEFELRTVSGIIG